MCDFLEEEDDVHDNLNSYSSSEFENEHVEQKHELRNMDCSRSKVCRHHKNFFGNTRRTLLGCKACGLNMCERCYPRAHPN